jgi:hypothetical protein
MHDSILRRVAAREQLSHPEPIKVDPYKGWVRREL